MTFIVSLILLLWQFVDAHTWIDCFDTDRTKIYNQSASYIFGGSGGNGFCEGYGAGYRGRGDINIGTEYTYKMLENEVEAGTAVCATADADTYTNTNWRRRISVEAGVTVYFAYLPNGHIVKDKKAIGTQHGIYWTGEVGTSLTSTLDMKKENLINTHTMDYDDGNCGETYDFEGNPGGRAGDGWPCIGLFVVPTGTAPGIYSMVWYWTFWLNNEASYVDQSQARGYFGAAYSTCFEVEVTSSGSVNSTVLPANTSANTREVYKSGATATFSGLKSGDESLAGVHAADSSSGSEEFSDVHFDNATVSTDESSGSNASLSHDTVWTLTDNSVPGSSSDLSIVAPLLLIALF
ncbi:hypothetical protein PI124_g11322 [Phytophthora idaei]|nr:hypothetical protein PI125_g10260 [Phytophthora idaei]KAG3158559.1 hypothetical protein PI126_g7804 [Phytophthora idaei]KAG3243900.1 hypothetical protein PI124_g11322 [Phytophthora idaei]